MSTGARIPNHRPHRRRFRKADSLGIGRFPAVGVDYGPLEDHEKQARIHELDAVAAHLYGLTREHLQVVFETFHDGWDHEPRMNAVLEYYDEWAGRLDAEEYEHLGD